MPTTATRDAAGRARGRPPRAGAARPARVAVVDPLPCFALGLERLLSASESLSVVAAPDDVTTRGPLPDVVLADVPALPPERVDALADLMSAAPSVKLAVFTSSRSMAAFRRALDLGARAYVSKSATPSELVDALRHVAAGGIVLGPLPSFDAGRDGAPGPMLEAAEATILSLLAEGLENDEIARRLHMSGSSLTRRLRAIVAKLNARNRLHAVVRAARLGYIEL